MPILRIIYCATGIYSSVFAGVGTKTGFWTADKDLTAHVVKIIDGYGDIKLIRYSYIQ